MITRIREGEGGYVVTISSVAGVIDTRTTPDLAEAFALQRTVQETGAFPVAAPIAPVAVEPAPVPRHDPTPKTKRGHK